MTFIIKPTHRCNFRCKYCYVEDILKNNDKDIEISDAKILIDKIVDYSILNCIKTICLLWHGGEPLLWGFNNFETILNYCSEKAKWVKFSHSIQTNLSLIDEAFISLFKFYKVRVGFSLDGPAWINDSIRVTTRSRGTSNIIEKKISLCKKHDLNIGAIAVATRFSISKIHEIYNYFNCLSVNFKLNPIFKSGEANSIYNIYGITPYEYAVAMISLFDLWTSDINSTIEITSLKEIASNIAVGLPRACCFVENCQDSFTAISPNGDLYPCGRFCNNEEFCFGNIFSDNLNVMILRKKIIFRKYRYEKLMNNDCNKCKYFTICNGGCLHDAYSGNNDILGKTNLCEAYKNIFNHIELFLKNGLFLN
jgi:uncharacterized protein